MKKSLKIHHTN